MARPRDGEFLPLLRSALARLYDHAYLETHALADILLPTGPPPGRTQAQELRKILLDAIECLNPPNSLPSHSPARRPYEVLFLLYVEGHGFEKVAERLAIGDRQLRRERHRALEALAAILQDRYLSLGEQSSTTEGDRPEGQINPALQGELNQFSHHREKIDPRDLITGLASTLQSLAVSHRVVLHTTLPQGLPIIYGSSTVVRQALLGILSHALPHFQGGSLSLEAFQDEEIVFLVARLANQMEKQGERPAPSKLVESEIEVSRQLAASQRAELQLRQEEEGGLTISLALPVDYKTVLVVEDNKAVVELFERYLALHPYRVLWAKSGDEAMHLALESPPNMIVLDVMLPDCDGWELLQRLSIAPATRHIPVIVCTVLDNPELAFSLGARSFLKKPVHQADLLAALERVQVAGEGTEVRNPARHSDT